MKALLALFISTAFALSGISQDIDIYTKNKNSNYELPSLNPQTSFEEFQILNRNLRMQDMAYAAIVPGYVHFKIKDPAVGFAMLGLRSAGYAGIYYILSDDSFSLQDLINNSPPDNTNDLTSFTSQKNITYISLGLIITTYMFDWIHGKHRLEKKQEMIRYKYSLKLNLSYSPSPINPNTSIPTIGIRYSF